jgi:hypothetical protein
MSLAVLALWAMPARLESQGLGANTLSGYRLEIGAVASTPVVEDGNGVSLRRGIGISVAGDVVWTIDDRTEFVATLRGSVAPLRLRSLDRRWSGGWSQQFDFALRVEHELAASLVGGAGLAVALLRGPGDLIPFRKPPGDIYGWGPELTLARLISAERNVHAVLAGDATRISPPGSDTRLVGGWIGRLRLGLRHAL